MYKKIQLTMAAILLASVTMFSTSVKAQGAFGVGAGVTYLATTLTNNGTSLTSGDNGFPTFGIVINPYYNLNEKMRIDAHILYYFQKDKTTTLDLGPFGKISEDVKTTLLGFGANFQYAFVGEFRGDGIVVYGLAGLTDFNAGFSGTASVSFGGTTTSTAVTSPGQSFLDLNIGVGAEYPVNPNFSIYVEPRYAIGVSGSSNGTKLGGFATNLGVRYTFGSK
jgi:hypothetical protein